MKRKGHASDNSDSKRMKSSDTNEFKVGPSTSQLIMRNFHKFILEEAATNGATYQLKPFDMKARLLEHMTLDGCGEDTVNPFDEDDSITDVTELRNLRMESLKFITKLSQDQMRVRKLCTITHLLLQEKMIGIISKKLEGSMADSVQRWRETNSANLLNPEFHGVHHLVEHIWLQSGERSTDKFTELHRALYAMFYVEGKGSPKEYWERVCTQTSEMNAAACKASDKILTLTQLTTLVWSVFGKANSLAHLLSEFKQRYRDVEREISDLDPTLKSAEEFEERYGAAVSDPKSPEVISFNESFAMNSRRLGGTSEVGNMSSAGSVATNAARTSTSTSESNGVFPRDIDKLNQSDRDKIQTLIAAAVVETVQHGMQLHATLDAIRLRPTTGRGSAAVRLIADNNETTTAIAVMNGQNTATGAARDAAIQLIKDSAVVTAALEESAEEEKLLGTEFVHLKATLKKEMEAKSLAVFLRDPIPVDPMVARLQAQNVLNEVTTLRNELTIEVARLTSERKLAMNVEAQEEQRRARNAPLLDSVAQLTERVEMSRPPDMTIIMAMVKKEFACTAIKKALSKLTPAVIVQDLNDLWVRTRSQAAHCTHCKTNTHATAECRVLKGQREHAMVAQANAKTAAIEAAKVWKAKREKERAEKLKTVDCHLCGKLGHYKSDCKEKPKKVTLGAGKEG